MMRKAGAVTVGVLCAYELAALSTGRIPTVSRVCWWARRHPAGALGIWAGLGVLSWHLLVDGAEDVATPRHTS
jgi:hypothetical protein